MKKFILFIILSYSFNCFGYIGLNKNLYTEAVETVIQLNSKSGQLIIKEYYLSTTKSEASEINTQVTQIGLMIQKANYCDLKYKFKHFKSVFEEIYSDRHFVTVFCKLSTSERNIKNLMTDLFSNILNRQVCITVGDESIGLHFDGAKDIDITHNNTQGIYEHKNGTRLAIYWKNGNCVFEIAFVNRGRGFEDHHSIRPYFTHNITSNK